MVRNETPRTLAGRAMGIGLCAPILLLSAQSEGGLAPLAVAAAVAAVVGVPAARAEWRALPPERPALRAAVAGMADIAGLLLVASVAAPVVREAGWGGVLLTVVGWMGALALGQRPRLAWGLAIGLLVLAAGRAVAAAMSARVDTLLAPQWGAASSWLGPALVAGLAMAAAGTGQWTHGARRPPGVDRTAWSIAGGATILGVAQMTQVAARFDATLGVEISDVGRDAIVAAAALLGAAAVLGRPCWDEQVGRNAFGAALGCAATLWLAGPAHEATPLVQWGLVPGLGAGLLLTYALASPPRERSTMALGAGAAVAVGAVVLSAPALPVGPMAAASAGLLLSAAFWLVATRVAVATAGVP